MNSENSHIPPTADSPDNCTTTTSTSSTAAGTATSPKQRHSCPAIFSRQFRQYCIDTTIHGLNEIAISGSIKQKLFCALLFLGAFCAAAYGVWQIIHQYRTTPVSTSFFIENSNKLELPDVTICPFSRFNKHILDRHNVSTKLVAYMEHAFFMSGRTYDFNNRTTIRGILTNKTTMLEMETQLNLLKISLNVTKFEDLVDKISFQCHDFVAYCMQKSLSVDCCRSATPLLTGLGKCYKLRAAAQTGSGFGMGHTIVIKLPLDNFTSGENLLMNGGVLVKLTEPGKGYEFDASFVPTGVHALFQLRSTRMEFLHNPPHFLCHVSESEMDPYAPLICYQNCLLKPIEDNCNCRYIGLPEHNGNRHLDACNTSDLFSCAYGVLTEKVFYAGSTYARDCRSKCPQRCNYWQYDITMSYARYPSYVSHHYMNHSEFLRVQSSNLILDFFYEKMEYTKIKHFPAMSAETFISNIGGQMSLWIGMSIHGFIHFCVFGFLSVNLVLFPKTPKTRNEADSEANESCELMNKPSCPTGSTTTSAVLPPFAKDQIEKSSYKHPGHKILIHRKKFSPNYKKNVSYRLHQNNLKHGKLKTTTTPTHSPIRSWLFSSSKSQDLNLKNHKHGEIYKQYQPLSHDNNCKPYYDRSIAEDFVHNRRPIAQPSKSKLKQDCGGSKSIVQNNLRLKKANDFTERQEANDSMMYNLLPKMSNESTTTTPVFPGPEFELSSSVSERLNKSPQTSNICDPIIGEKGTSNDDDCVNILTDIDGPSSTRLSKGNYPHEKSAKSIIVQL